MLVALGTEVPRHLGYSNKLQSEEESTINVVHYNPAVTGETQMATARNVEQTDDKKMLDNWEDSISITE